MGAGPRRALEPACDEELAAPCHRLAGAADWIGPVEIRDRIFERSRAHRAGFAESRPRGPRHDIGLGEHGMRIPHATAPLAQSIEWQGTADGLRQSPQNLPVLACLTWREYRAPGELHAAFRIYISAVLLGVGGSRQDDIGAARSAVAVMPLVNHKCRSDIGCIDLIRTEKVKD